MAATSNSNGNWSIQIEELAGPAAAEAPWVALEQRAYPSFFQSWGWIGAWLLTFPEDAGLMFLRIQLDGRDVGLSVLGRNVVSASRIFSSKALLVSEAGDPEHDALTVEHSGLLIEAGLEGDVLHRALEYLRAVEWSWDELFVSGVEEQRADAYEQAANAAGMSYAVRFKHPYFYVDLTGLQGRADEYLATLSRNTRYQIRRSMRLYEQRGQLTIQTANSLDEALEVFAKLRVLHQEHWTGRGEVGAFPTDRVTDFHQALICECFPRGQVQLLTISVAGVPIGYLYNFVLDGVVSNYQTAFVYEEDGRLKPGLVSHTLAIQWCAEHEMRVYDLLMGDQQFKRSLGKEQETMVWLVLGNTSTRMRIRHQLRKLWSWLS